MSDAAVALCLLWLLPAADETAAGGCTETRDGNGGSQE